MCRRLLLAILFAVLAAPASAGAAVIQDFSAFQSGTNGIALGPDGNFWVAEQGTGTVARMTPAGDVTFRVAVGAGPTSVSAGPDGTVWVSVTGDDRLARIDTRPATPTVQNIATGSACGPVAIANGGNNRMYFTLPNAGSCGVTNSRIGSVAADGTGVVATTDTAGPAFDIAVANGKVYAAEFGNDAVRRYTLANAPVLEASVNVAGAPDGITVDGGGFVWVSLNAIGGVARFPGVQSGGTAQTFMPSGATLSEPFGIVAGPDGNVYVTGSNNGTLARVSSTGTFKFFTVGGKPWDIVNGPDGDLYFTDQESSRVRRFIAGVPRLSASAAAATAATSASLSATVDARGSATAVSFDYGPTTAYGSTATAQATGVGPVAVGAVLTGLTPGTTYHVRVRVANEDGEGAPSADTTFTTPAGPPPPATTPVLKARANFSWRFFGSRTALSRVRITSLSGGETIRITCKGGGCPLKSKTYKKVKKGARTLTSLFGTKKKLRKGAKIVITVSKPGSAGSTTTLTIGKKRKDPKIVRKQAKPT